MTPLLEFLASVDPYYRDEIMRGATEAWASRPIEGERPRPIYRHAPEGRFLPSRSPRKGGAYVRAAIAREAAELAGKAAGRNNALNASTWQLCQRFPEHVEEIRAAMLEAALASGLDPHEARATIRSATRRG